MSLQICAFKGYNGRSPSGTKLQIMDGPPADVTIAAFTGVYTVPVLCTVIKISGTGTIAWTGVANPESFTGVEFRGVQPGQQFTVA